MTENDATQEGLDAAEEEIDEEPAEGLAPPPRRMSSQ